MSQALLVIDVQNAFFDGVFAPPLPDGEALLETVRALTDRARDSGVPVFFIQHCEPGSEFDRGIPSWQLHPGLGVRPDETVIEKTKPDSFFETDLDALLKARGVDHVVIAGNQTEHCVNATSRAAKARGYAVTLASDAHGTWDGEAQSAAEIIASHNAALGEGIATVKPAAEIAFEPKE